MSESVRTVTGESARRTAVVVVGLVALGLVGQHLLTTLDGLDGQVCVLVMVWTIATTGLNVVLGLAGYPSLVQASFFGGGAYISSLLLDRDVPPVLCAVLAIVLTMLVALLIGIVFARTRGQYFAIGTLFSSAVITLVMINERGITRGQQGMPVGLAWELSLNTKMLSASVPLSLFAFYLIARSRFGDRLRSIREDEDLAAHVGVATTRVKLLALVISSVFGAWAGVLEAQADGLIGPSQFTFAKGFLMFVAIGLGGYGRLLTPLIGSFLVVGVPELLDLGPGTSQIALGVLFIVVTLTVPGGLIGGAESLVRRIAAAATRPRTRELAPTGEAPA